MGEGTARKVYLHKNIFKSRCFLSRHGFDQFSFGVFLFSTILLPVGQDVSVSRRRHGGERKVYAGQVQREGLLAVRTIARNVVLGTVVVGDPVALGFCV